MSEMPEFVAFPKIPRLRRNIVITEKIDGTNAQIVVPTDPDAPILVGSRNRWITPGKSSDNYGFAQWVAENDPALRRLGYGRHFGEWYGAGIGARRYNLDHRRWALFNTTRWADGLPEGVPSNVGVVPVLYNGPNDSSTIDFWLDALKTNGSYASPGYMDPEGIVVFHTASGTLAKVTLGSDGHKELQNG